MGGRTRPRISSAVPTTSGTTEIVRRGARPAVPKRLRVRLGDEPSRGDGGGESGMVAFVLVGIGGGELGDRTVERGPLAEVCGDGDAVPPAGVGTAEGGTTDAGVQGGTGHPHGLDVSTALPVVELAHVVVPGHTVDAGDPLPAEEDVGRRLHEPLTHHDPLAMIRMRARAQEGFENGGR